jgi:uncharacterized membrane protein
MIEAFAIVNGPGGFPNLHALAVHFPVALLSVALLLDLACLVARSKLWLDRCATTLYVAGTVGAAAAYLTGQLAAPQATSVTGEIRSVLADHGDLGLLTLLAYLVVAVLRLIVSWLGRDDRRITTGFFRLLALVASASALVLLMLAVDRGSALVYRHGVGRTASSAQHGGPQLGSP